MSEIHREVLLAHSQVHMMTATSSSREYEVSVAWPAEDAPESGFPVLYVVDGRALFASVADSVRSRSARTESTGVVPAIIVGISPAAASANLRERRTYEFTSATPAHGDEHDKLLIDDSSKYGGAESFLHFIVNDVKPMIAKAFRVNRSRETLVGHSLGALFVVEAQLSGANQFDSYVGLSPSIWWDADRVLASARVRQTHRRAQRIFLSVGEFEEALAPWQQNRSADDLARLMQRRHERAMIGNTRLLADALGTSLPPGSEAVFDLIAGEDHASIVPAALSRTLRYVLRPV